MERRLPRSVAAQTSAAVEDLKVARVDRAAPTTVVVVAVAGVVPVAPDVVPAVVTANDQIKQESKRSGRIARAFLF
jgi:hypothetical protein